jgi:hypothetical protein
MSSNYPRRGASEPSPVKWLSANSYQKLPLPERALAWAASQVGIKETQPNKGANVQEYQAVAGLGPQGGFAWCAAFVYWCLIRAGANPASLPRKGECAAVRNWVDWAQKHNRLDSKPSRGCLFFWLNPNQTGHIGFCLSGSIITTFRTIEGNTDPNQGSREGDGVYRRTRTTAGLKKFSQHGYINLKKL